MKLFIRLFYSISLVLEAKRLAYVQFTAKFKDKYFISGSGKADKTNNNERSSQNNTSNQ